MGQGYWRTWNADLSRGASWAKMVSNITVRRSVRSHLSPSSPIEGAALKDACFPQKPFNDSAVLVHLRIAQILNRPKSEENRTLESPAPVP